MFGKRQPTAPARESETRTRGEDRTRAYLDATRLQLNGEWYDEVSIREVKVYREASGIPREWEFSFTTPDAEYVITTQKRFQVFFKSSFRNVKVTPLHTEPIYYSDVTHVSVDNGVLTLVLWEGQVINYVLKNIVGWTSDPAA